MKASNRAARHTIRTRAAQTRTRTDLYRALANGHAVTITYLKPGETEPTVRTIEISELRTSAVQIKKNGQVKGGDIMVIAMCPLRASELANRPAAAEETTGKTAAREFSLSGILSYTVHRGMGYVLPRPANTTYERPELAPADDEMALIYFELERDPDDADYRPRVRLAA